MDKGIQKFCVWTGILGGLFIFIGLVPLLGFMPAPKPSADAATIAAMYRSNQTGAVLGATFMLSGFAFVVPFYAVISYHIEAMTGPNCPLARAQMALCIMALTMPGVVGSTAWLTAAYRVERPDETIQMLNDFGWIIIFTPVIAGLLQVMMLGIAVFRDKQAVPSFPRWFGWFNIWVGVSFLPAGLLGLFKAGPFAWNGLFAYWLGLVAFGIWFTVTAWLLVKKAA